MEPHGVGVTALSPGFVQTHLGQNTVKIGGDIRQYSDVVMTSDVTPAHVGAMVVEAIERNDPYIVTHKGVWRGIEKRFNALKAACDFRDGA